MMKPAQVLVQNGLDEACQGPSCSLLMRQKDFIWFYRIEASLQVDHCHNEEGQAESQQQQAKAPDFSDSDRKRINSTGNVVNI